MKKSAGAWGAALLWLASAVKVAGYTWDSMTGEYSPFPNLTSNGGTAVPVPPAVQRADSAMGVPNLAHGKTFPAQVAGVAASPITPDTVLPGSGNVITSVAGSIGRFLKGLLP